MTLDDSKKWLRQYFLRRRQLMTESLRKKKSKQILERLYSSPLYKKAPVIALYCSFGSEVETWDLLFHSWRAGKKVLVPMTTQGFSKPFFNEITPQDKLVKTKYGYLELGTPKKAFGWNNIDLILVPGLGFDRNGFRIGYGGGVYDRLLRKASNSSHVGLFFRTGCFFIATGPL